MLIIQQGAVNKLVTTLDEKKVSNTTIYLFELVNGQSKLKTYCVVSDKSTTTRYNTFCVQEMSGVSGTTNPLNGQMNLPLAGFYYYNVYENPNSLTVPAGLNQVEQGKCLVLTNVNITTPVFESAINPTKKVYNKQNYPQ